MVYRFPINGIRHHDFGGRLDELYSTAPGRRVTLSVEHENVAEADAVICFMGVDHVGYVRSGRDRERALAVLEAAGRRSMLGSVADVDRTNRIVWVEVTADSAGDGELPTTGFSALDSWVTDVPLMPEPTEAVRLHAVADTLEMMLERGEAWSEEMDGYMDAVAELCWSDMSVEFRRQLERILSILPRWPEAADDGRAAARMEYVIDRMGSPEVRRRQVEWIREMARSEEMKHICEAYGDEAHARAWRLPRALAMLGDFEQMMARLWYLRGNYRTIRGVQTLLALRIMLTEQGQHGTKVAAEREPAVLFTPEAMTMWQALQKAEFIDDDFQPMVSANRATVIAAVMGEALDLNPLWKPFEDLWQIKDLTNKYSQAKLAKYYSGLYREINGLI